MSDHKRWILFFVMSLGLALGAQYLLDALGLTPKRPPAPDAAAELAAEDEGGPTKAFANDPNAPAAFSPETGTTAALTADPAVPAAAGTDVKLVPADQLVLGSTNQPTNPASEYRIQVQLAQRGAGVRRVILAQHQTELLDKKDRGTPLTLLDADPVSFPDAFGPPLSLQVVVPRKDELPPAVYSLGDNLWESVPDDQGRIVRPLEADPETRRLEGEAVVFQTTVPALGLTVTKTLGLRKGVDGLELGISFSSDKPQTLAYRLLGPYGLPIEGEWYNTSFRDLFFGKINGAVTELETKTPSDVLDKEAQGDPIRTTSLPLKFAGIENQYFAAFLEPDPIPASPELRHDERTLATVIRPTADKLKSEVSVVVESRPLTLTAGTPVAQSYSFFSGPKTAEALAPFGAEELTAYRKGWQIPVIGTLATYLARNVIAPLLDQIYGVTKTVAGFLGGQRGSYGIAIILLTIVVRLCIFPLSRKQAIAAKRMQDLQPQMVAIREKYKDDKEKIGRETMLLYKKSGVNPMGGCLLPLIQMPIFLGLWQALNNSVALRNSPFLWISNLAAPDMLFKFPSEVPILGPYFNLLPFAVVALMLVQTKLFAPPATTPEQKQQQQVMNVMLLVMAVMFYKVPSGLGLYFITSSLWSICERLLLKSTPVKPLLATEAGAIAEGADSKSNSRSRSATPVKEAGGWRDRLKERLDQVMEDAAHDKTVRNSDKDRTNDRKRPTKNGGNNPPDKKRG